MIEEVFFTKEESELTEEELRGVYKFEDLDEEAQERVLIDFVKWAATTDEEEGEMALEVIVNGAKDDIIDMVEIADLNYCEDGKEAE